MRCKVVFSVLFSLFIGTANANWAKINDVDYTWGPFNIYHITLFTETGKYEPNTRPLMLTLQYKKPWEGRDFAVSLARTWKNLGIDLPEQDVDNVVTKLRKTFPDIKPEDTLHYIALEDRGYFILNDKVVSGQFPKPFNDAIVAIWLDPKMDISRQLLDPSYKPKPPSEEAKLLQQREVEQTQTTENVNAKTAESMSEKMPKEKTEQETEKQAEVKLANEESGKPKEEKIKEEAKEVEKEEKNELNIENPELFISPIYDDFLMLEKRCI